MKWWNALVLRAAAALYVRAPGRQTTDSQSPETQRILLSLLSAAGIRIDSDQALKQATVWACVTYLSRTVAQLPWHVLQEKSNGDRVRMRTHQVDYLLGTRANPNQTAFSFVETMTGWAAREGNAVAEIVRDGAGKAAALWPIHPSRVCFELNDETGELQYPIMDGAGGRIVLGARDVFHVRGFGEGAVGLNVTAYAAESLGWAKATELFGARMFGSGMNPSVLVSMQGRLTPDAKKALEDELEEKYVGAKGRKTVVVDNGGKFERWTITPEEGQFLETRQHQVEEICRWFGVPPHKVMHLLRGTFSNIEHQSIEVVVDSITPWALRFEQEADYKLFGQNRGALYTKMDLKGLLRGDFKGRQEGLALQRRNGVISTNEWRRLEDMNGIGAKGDIYTIEANMTRLEKVGETPARRASDKPAAPAEPEQDGEERPPVERAREQLERTLH